MPVLKYLNSGNVGKYCTCLSLLRCISSLSRDTVASSHYILSFLSRFPSHLVTLFTAHTFMYVGVILAVEIKPHGTLVQILLGANST